jgi:hypothetical protein
MEDYVLLLEEKEKKDHFLLGRVESRTGRAQ